MPAGRPPKYNSVEELQEVIESYFSELVMEIDGKIISKPRTMSGLARALGMSRQALCDYSHKDEFLDALKEARQRVEEDVETRLMSGVAATGCIFNLKNNFGWRDKTEMDHTTNGKEIKQVQPVYVSKDDNTSD